MEKKNNIGNGILVVLLFVVVCFLFYYIVVADKSKSNKNVVENKIVVNDELKGDIVSTIDKYLLNIFDSHSNKYCGELDYDDTYTSGIETYSKSILYSSIDDIRKSYSSIITDNYFDNVLSNKFIEHDGNVYCLVSGRGSLDYTSGNINIANIDVFEDSLNVKGVYNTTANDMNPSDIFNFEASMVKSNDIWVIDSFNEHM